MNENLLKHLYIFILIFYFVYILKKNKYEPGSWGPLDTSDNASGLKADFLKKK